MMETHHMFTVSAFRSLRKTYEDTDVEAGQYQGEPIPGNKGLATDDYGNPLPVEDPDREAEYQLSTTLPLGHKGRDGVWLPEEPQRSQQTRPSAQEEWDTSQTEALKVELNQWRASHAEGDFGYIPIDGGYRYNDGTPTTEDSFCVWINPRGDLGDKLFETAEYFRSAFYQESVLVTIAGRVNEAWLMFAHGEEYSVGTLEVVTELSDAIEFWSSHNNRTYRFANERMSNWDYYRKFAVDSQGKAMETYYEKQYRDHLKRRAIFP
ncbi:MAG: hypothetical protein LBH13_00770 [Cellulomonadaceae bacterium]|nr:hypothetical protein [Cellulomonadaceae bacterium]